ncbi:hypothetical protein [Haloferula sp. A504]|uniref:hypothetical protein n=1 Tax=Haloferula sp. A504 TaxID=3373601 RepID=UPI0031BCF719|nr:hypothetical protein [Verrucomicrobiaceae bacterium E54]
MMHSGLIGIVLWIPVLVGLWVGVIGLGKAGRGAAWWLMLVGISSLCLGLVFTVLGSFLAVQNISASIASSGATPPPTFGGYQFILAGGIVALGLGLLLFVIGFALHGFQARRSRERISELEMVIEAQNEQLARFQGERPA